MNLPSPDNHHLLAAQGWLELGNHLEANTELELISAPMRVHPNVLEVRWQIYARAQKWTACLDIARSIKELAPNQSTGWTLYSNALHELGRTQEAFDMLHKVTQEFQDEWQIPFDLARFSASLGRHGEAQIWFQKAANLSPSIVPQLGIEDPDLKAMWDDLSSAS